MLLTIVVVSLDMLRLGRSRVIVGVLSRRRDWLVNWLRRRLCTCYVNGDSDRQARRLTLVGLIGVFGIGRIG